MNSKQKLQKIFNNSIEIGDKSIKKYRLSKSNNDAGVAIKSYNCAIRAKIVEILISNKK